MNLYLTTITLNPADQDAVADLDDVQRLHRRLMLLAPDDLGDNARRAAGVLFRIEQDADTTQILVQTRTEPDASRFPVGYGDFECRDIGPVLERLEPGTEVAYRITVNPSKRLAVDEGPGKLQVFKGAAADEWWTERATTCGLELGEFSSVVLPEAIGKKGPDPRRWIHHVLRRFDGTATVTDPDAVREAVQTGIGRAKAFGAGLLSLRVAE
ncbi:type I-E CRISPR-associated protein Cas6/Cse3/CasE [Actinorhabdospora filicis]|uniref:Type I-E CRISPR-associated protein Cas6/Cse3/CasE n=1 Tax=Actinorhabdospora filicis TaxID=1785913 RepID=A0A9W6W963_9ACTN|nr:type I-E CRISPR-associated protein Cas6/Cse3/CasE [Actinorhabdospora filicis]GLZ78244.1 type I-E CRISPR-associated protein Cas6/Cse3/CasE [Actinorhabdospora filicis]